MKYLILRKRPEAAEDHFMEEVGAGGGVEFPFVAETEEIERDSEVADLRRDPNVKDAIPAMPFQLIEPVKEESAAEPPGKAAWGVEAVGALTSPQTGAGVTVAVLDSGIDLRHPAFNCLAFDPQDLMDFTTNERGEAGKATDERGHGTHVAGILFGREVDGTRIGVAPGVKRAVIGKLFGDEGASSDVIYNAIMWALGRRADVICMSFGMDFPGMAAKLMEKDYPPNIATSKALEAYRLNLRLFDTIASVVKVHVARGRGALLVAAAGNESRRHIDPRFTVGTAPPASAEGFISVGAVSRIGDASSPFAVARFSNTGCRVAAPGMDIPSAKLGGGLMTDSGTSMAAPHVAGVAALWTEKLFGGSKRPPEWAGDVRSRLEASAINTSGLNRNDVGIGIVQAPQ